jgi:uncharacterized repeat protein (TIGR03803 family)
VFSVKTDGMGFTNLYSFNRGPGGGPQRAGLILSGNTLYGTTEYGGNWGYGSVFALNTDGTGFTNLYSFTAPKGYIPTNADGAYPIAALTISSNTLYGTAAEGGAWGWGTVFKVNTDGTGFTNLHSISAIDQRTRTNSDGTITAGPLILCGHTLYGAAELGGSFSNGTVFAVNTDGTGFTNLHNFAALLQSTNSDGTSPKGGLILSGNTLFGTASGGGTFGNGTIFSISFPPQLTVIPSGTNVILTWPTNSGGFSYDGYILQSTTNLVSPVWTTNSPAPVVVNGQNTVTNLISGKQQFFRLSE